MAYGRTRGANVSPCDSFGIASVRTNDAPGLVVVRRGIEPVASLPTPGGS